MINLGYLCLLLLVQSVFISCQDPPVLPDHLKAAAKKLAKMCIDETGVSLDLLKQGADDLHLPDDRNVKCFAYCMFDKVGLIDAEHVMHLHYLLDVMPPEFHEIIEHLISACDTKAGADGCEIAYNTMNCYLQARPDVFRPYVGDISVHNT